MLSTTETDLRLIEPEHFRRLQDEKIAAAVAAGGVLVQQSGTRRNGTRLYDHVAGGPMEGRVVALYLTWNGGSDIVFFYVRSIKDLSDNMIVATLNTHFDGRGCEVQVCFEDGAPIETIVTRHRLS